MGEMVGKENHEYFYDKLGCIYPDYEIGCSGRLDLALIGKNYADELMDEMENAA